MSAQDFKLLELDLDALALLILEKMYGSKWPGGSVAEAKAQVAPFVWNAAVRTAIAVVDEVVAKLNEAPPLETAGGVQ